MVTAVTLGRTMPQCSICVHDEREAIDAALVAGQSFRTVAERFGTATTTLHRHKDHLPAELAKSQQAAEVAHADSLLEQMQGLQQMTLDILDRAYRENEQRIALTAVREARGNLELLAKLLGELNEQPTVNVLVTSPEWARTRGRLLAALAPYPEARTAVMEALRGD
jgi:hypothetical protein